MKSGNQEIRNWIYQNKPATATPGFYAIMYCWDIQEGIFVAASYWKGDSWSADLPINAHAGPFATIAEATAWAEAHDPEA